MSLSTQSKKRFLSVREMILFGIFGAVMYCSKLLTDALPNIHLIGMFIMVFTLVYRKKALVPIYVFVLLAGLFSGFAVWWLPYIYIWTVLWGAVMLLPRTLPRKAQYIVYPAVCALHGLAYGTLYAPVQALVYHMSIPSMLAWIAAGFPFDIIHAAGNLALGLLVPTLSSLLWKLENKRIS